VTQLCLTTYISQVLTHTTGMTQFLEFLESYICLYCIQVAIFSVKKVSDTSHTVMTETSQAC